MSHAYHCGLREHQKVRGKSCAESMLILREGGDMAMWQAAENQSLLFKLNIVFGTCRC